MQNAARLAASILLGFVVVLLGGAVMLLLATALGGCAAAPAQKRASLPDQILTPYPGHKGLVYRHCAEYEASGKCSKPELKDYLLSDVETRRRFIAARIACWVGGKLYAPCENENALCHRRLGKRPFLGIIGKKPETIEKLSFESDYGLMLDAKTVCGSADSLRQLRSLLQ